MLHYRSIFYYLLMHTYTLCFQEKHDAREPTLARVGTHAAQVPGSRPTVKVLQTHGVLAVQLALVLDQLQEVIFERYDAPPST
jgi:hypothetical protein